MARDIKYQKYLDLLMTDEQMCKTAGTEFGPMFKKKFAAGQKKYLTPLTKKDCLRNLGEELIDAWAYLKAEQERQRVVRFIVDQYDVGAIEAREALGALKTILTWEPDRRVGD